MAQLKQNATPAALPALLAKNTMMPVRLKIVSFLPQEHLIYLNSKYDTTHVRPITGSHGATDFLTNHRTAQPQDNRPLGKNNTIKIVPGAAHGHGPPCVTSGERTLLSAWLKQGRDWLMLQGRAGLVL